MSNPKNQPSKTPNPKKSIIAKTNTGEIFPSPTNPTLVEFHNKNASLPEWRLQLQNTVRQRQGRSAAETEKVETPSVQRAKLPTGSGAGLKIETIKKIEETEIARAQNPTLASALERITNSRQKFLTEEQPVVSPVAPAAGKSYPFHIAGKTNNPAPKKTEVSNTLSFSAKPELAVPLKKDNKDFDTNKLPKLPKPAKISTDFEALPAIAVEEEAKIEEKTKVEEEIKIETKAVVIEKVVAEKVVKDEIHEAEEADDCAPFAMRFNAGLFDLIIGSFATFVLLSPFMLLGGNWFTLTGLTAFLATCAVVMFIYMTTTVGMYGKTFGMRLFSLEVIDIEGENYPTLHQAAVSSSLYLMSLVFAGAGFLTVFFNDEKRAVHDLASGTVVVKEF